MSQVGRDEIRKQIRTQTDLIPALPEVVSKAIELIDDPDTEAADFETLLSRDPPLVANVLRLANSPLYATPHKKETIRDAVVAIGLKGLRGVLLCSTMKNFVGSQFACYGKDAKTLWRHAVAAAAAARSLGRPLRSDGESPEELFVGGLLHDVGKLLLAPFLMRMGIVVSRREQPTHEVELHLLGMTHMEAGQLVADRWNLSPLVRSVISHHHDERAPEESRRAVAIVRLADQVVTVNGQAAGRLQFDKDRLARDLELVRIPRDEWDATRKSVTAEVTELLLQL